MKNCALSSIILNIDFKDFIIDRTLLRMEKYIFDCRQDLS